MKSGNWLLITLIVIIMGCSTSTATQPAGDAALPLTLSLAPAYAMGYTVNQVRATITRDDFVDSMNLAIVDTVATGTFNDLLPGIYVVSIQIFDDENELIATGSGTGEVVAGKITTVIIQMSFLQTTGELEIIVIWPGQVIDPPTSILFIGNSYTASSGGMGALLQDFTTAAFGDSVLATQDVTFGGYTLEMHWNNATTLAAIEHGNWDVVVLQEQSTRPIDDPDLMYQYADSLCTFIRMQGAEPAFFMTWARENDPAMIDGLAAAYNYCGATFDAPVISCGRAFQLCGTTYPDIPLYRADGSHPSSQGMYLALSTFFSEFWDVNPQGIEWSFDPEITDVQRGQLQECAWLTAQQY